MLVFLMMEESLGGLREPTQTGEIWELQTETSTTHHGGGIPQGTVLVAVMFAFFSLPFVQVF